AGLIDDLPFDSEILTRRGHLDLPGCRGRGARFASADRLRERLVTTRGRDRRRGHDLISDGARVERYGRHADPLGDLLPAAEQRRVGLAERAAAALEGHADPLPPGEPFALAAAGQAPEVADPLERGEVRPERPRDPPGPLVAGGE